MHLLIVMEGETRRWVEGFARALPDATISVWQDDGPAVDADVAIVWHPPAALFTREKRLRAVFNLGAGVDGLLKLPNLPDDVPVVRLEDAGMTVQMAEYVLHALWRAARNFDRYDAAQQAADWQFLPVTRRHQWPVGVMGLGQVGARVAQALAQFEYPVAGWSRSRREVPGVECYAGIEELPAFLARTRVLVNALPLTSETRDILNADTFARLLPEGHVVNVGRGEHLVEADLLAALESGTLAGATLDVFRTEPLPVDHAFWRHPRIRVTPHTAARTMRAETIEQIADKIRRLSRGEPVTGVVERARGY